jgi:hypothetical protein
MAFSGRAWHSQQRLRPQQGQQQQRRRLRRLRRLRGGSASASLTNTTITRSPSASGCGASGLGAGWVGRWLRRLLVFLVAMVFAPLVVVIDSILSNQTGQTSENDRDF